MSIAHAVPQPNPQSFQQVSTDSVLCGRYRMQKLLGRGAMGSVYQAIDEKSGRRCAIKMLHVAASAADVEHSRFANEAMVVSQLFHPNIVEVHEFRRDSSGRPFLVMEFLDGIDLYDYLRQQGRLSLARVQEIILQVASALHTAHGIGIVHRDIKSRNIFLCQQRSASGVASEVVKVVDFGLAKMNGKTKQQTALGTILGTPEYLSPESTLGRSWEVDARADQWALAVTAYKMLSGRFPFEDEDVIRLLLKIRREPPPPIRALCPELPEYAAHALSRALSKDKQARFATIQDFARAFCGYPKSRFSPPTLAGDAEVPVLISAEETRPIQPRAIEKSEPTQTIDREQLSALLLASQTPGQAVPDTIVDDYSIRVLRSAPVAVSPTPPPNLPAPPSRPLPRRSSGLRFAEWLTLVAIGLSTGAGWMWLAHKTARSLTPVGVVRLISPLYSGPQTGYESPVALEQTTPRRGAR